ncbi:Thioredoxin-T [Orchesella cincta]|uniref:Thioredoxin-T n=1 Tax=Orchesella cincta TaxID=48709 RepID=A0A1D2NG98_ORCCI|nr:Thioredoxin-T [Orchesella cincta]
MDSMQMFIKSQESELIGRGREIFSDKDAMQMRYFVKCPKSLFHCGRAEFTFWKREDDLKSKLKAAADKLVVVDFYADWCGPCKMIAPKLEAWAVAMPNLVFFKVNVDECEDVARFLLTIFFIKINSNQHVFMVQYYFSVDQVTGANDGKLKALIDKHQ